MCVCVCVCVCVSVSLCVSVHRRPAGLHRGSRGPCQMSPHLIDALYRDMQGVLWAFESVSLMNKS